MILSRGFTPRVCNALAAAGTCALVFAPVFFVALSGIMLMVRGDGSAPAIARVAAAIVSFTVALLGVAFEGAIVPVVLFWSLVVFVTVFLGRLLVRGRAGHEQRDRVGRDKAVAFVAVIIFLVGTVLLMRSILDGRTSVDERKLVVEFVKRNAEVLQQAGENARVHIATHSVSRGHDPVTYEIAVIGKKRIYAVVEASRDSRRPTFTLLCLTPVSIGQRDPTKPRCEQPAAGNEGSLSR
jgi:amino acid transporter